MIVEKATTEELGWNVRELLSSLGIEFDTEGDEDTIFRHVAALGDATSADLTFCSGETEKAVVDIMHSGGGVILCKRQLKDLLQPRKGTQLIFLDNPRQSFVKVVNELQKRLR